MSGGSGCPREGKMTSGFERALYCLRQAALRHTGPTDGQLLQRYLGAGDDTAFAALVRRHGPMVLGVCRRILGHEQDAEDAFQATFLVLARKAASVVPPEAVGHWLYGVAYRAAQKAREAAARRRAHERQSGLRRPEECSRPDDRCDDLDREITRLPEIYRAPVVLCALQGLSRQEAARRLGCPEGTLSSRLAKARRLLAKRLGGPAAVAAALVAGRAAQAAPTLFTGAAAAAARGAVSTEVDLLARGVLNAMLLAKIRSVVTVVLVACALVAGVSALAFGDPAEPARESGPAAEGPKSVAPAEAVASHRFEGHTDGVMVVAFSPDGKQVLSGGACYGDGDPTVRLWEVATGKELRKLEGHTGGVYSLGFLPGGKKAVSGGAEGTIRIWDLETGKELKRLEGHEGTVYGLAVSPDGKSLLTGGEDATVRLWDLASGREVRRFDGHTDKVRAVAFSPNGKQALSGGVLSDPTLRLWDVATGKELAKYASDSEGIASVAFSADGKLALAGCMDNVVTLLKLSDGTQTRLEGHTKQIHGAVFTPDGQRVLSASYDQTVRLWDVATGKELCRFFGHTNWVWPVAVSPDGKYGLSGSLDKTIRLWRLPR
jgi:RNA polymerase sigma factor (sigma-70 family)